MTNEELLNKAQCINKLAERVCGITHTVRAILVAQERCAAIDWDADGLAHCYAGKLTEVADLLLEDAYEDSGEVAATAEGIADEVKAGVSQGQPEAAPSAEEFTPALFAVLAHEHIKHAEAKHPFFAHELVRHNGCYGLAAVDEQARLKRQIEDGKVYGETILLEELNEFLAEVDNGDITRAREEAGDVAAVLYRMIKLMEDKQ